MYTQRAGVLRLYLRGRVDVKLELAFLAIVHWQPLHQEWGKARSGTSTEGVEDKESLESSALISQLSDSVQALIYDLFSDSVVTTSVVVSGILLSSDELFRVEELSVSSSPDLIDDCRLKIQHNSTGDMFTRACLTEKCLFRIWRALSNPGELREIFCRTYLKKVQKESSPDPAVASVAIIPSGWIPCSRQ